ncbi:hypothetical protein SDC9_112538 [bioreactor metagenome]|uniref:Uncharacterized protein n=1 Tax=bioreactor metagenome TaxID=1076179 RepID=A0A645BM73_9ZZZZ
MNFLVHKQVSIGTIAECFYGCLRRGCGINHGVKVVKPTQPVRQQSAKGTVRGQCCQMQTLIEKSSAKRLTGLPPGNHLIHRLIDGKIRVVQHQSILGRLEGRHRAVLIPLVACLQGGAKDIYIS